MSNHSNHSFNRLALASLVAVAMTPACNQPVTNNPTGVGGSPINALEVVGPANIAPGRPAQFTANLHLADGTTKASSTPTDVRWRSSNTSVLQVSPAGLVTPVTNQGDANITAELRIGTVTRTATREVVVQPDGTFRLVGLVTEQGSPSVPVADARVEVVGGSSFAITDGFGNYRLYGVPPVADIRISANEYGTETFAVQLAANTTRNFSVNLTGTRPSFAGNYTMSIDVAGSCSGFNPPLSSDLQHRTYEAVVSQAGSALDVLLTSPQFRLNSLARGNHFGGVLIGGGVRFTLDWYDSYYYPFYGPTQYPSIAEQVSNNRYLVTEGTWNATGSTGSGLMATSNGGMLLWDSAFPASNSRLLAACFSPLTIKLIPR